MLCGSNASQISVYCFHNLTKHKNNTHIRCIFEMPIIFVRIGQDHWRKMRFAIHSELASSVADTLCKHL